MANLYENLIKNRGQMFQLQRNGEQLAPLKGVLNNETETNRKYIGVLPQTKLLAGDCLTDEAGRQFIITDVITHYFDGEAMQIKGYYEDVPETPGAIQKTAGEMKVCHNIQALKNQTQYLNDPDIADIHQVVDLIDMLLRTRLIARAAFLADYTAVLSRHPWLAESVKSILYQWLVQPTK